MWKGRKVLTTPISLETLGNGGQQKPKPNFFGRVKHRKEGGELLNRFGFIRGTKVLCERRVSSNKCGGGTEFKKVSNKCGKNF